MIKINQRDINYSYQIIQLYDIKQNTFLEIVYYKPFRVFSNPANPDKPC